MSRLKQRYLRSPIRYLWWIGRARVSAKHATPATPEALELERYKVEQHQLGLAVSIAPLGMVLLGMGSLSDLERSVDHVLISLVVLGSFSAGFLRVCLIAVSRQRVRKLLEAIAKDKPSFKERFTSLLIHAIADALAILSFLCLICHLLIAIWA